MTGADEQTKDSQRQNMRPPFAKRAALARPFMGMRISNEAKRLRAQGVDVINLSLGQPDYGAPEPVREAMRDLYDGRPLPYSDSMGLSELREAIARFYRTAHDVEVDPKRIVITEGGSAALLLATALSVDEGDEVIIADPSYPSNRELVRLLRRQGGRRAHVRGDALPPRSAARPAILERAHTRGDDHVALQPHRYHDRARRIA